MIVLYMLLGQLFSKRGGMRSEATAEMMDAKWVRVLSDGTREPIKLRKILMLPRGSRL